MKKVTKISELVAEMRTVWESFVVDLGYSPRQAKLFADGYIETLSRLSTLDKLSAIARQDDRCMSAGFRKAKISEKSALRRAKEIFGDKRKPKR